MEKQNKSHRFPVHLSQLIFLSFHQMLLSCYSDVKWNFDVLLTVHLSIILVINQLNAQILRL